jgi:hypothetical protein
MLRPFAREADMSQSPNVRTCSAIVADEVGLGKPSDAALVVMRR